MSLNSTPSANRLHIGIFGKRNAGKSSLINALTGQKTALVSPVAGTTTDPVYKAMELRGVGPVVFIDTAGLDDEGELGALRVEKTRQAADKTDIALLVLDAAPDVERQWLTLFQEKKIPVLAVLGKADTLPDPQATAAALHESLGLRVLPVSAQEGTGIEALRAAIVESLPADYDAISITGDLANRGDTVLLVMPQDIQAPKGRLILPQVQTIRELLDKGCTAVCTTADRIDEALAALAKPPELIITDSQVFPLVEKKRPPESRFTSFSILMAAYKGDIEQFAAGAKTIGELTESSRVLIAEACTHAPMEEDIGRVKIPALLRKKIGQGLTIDFVRGADFPDDLSGYDLVIHCGACMFNRRHVLSRLSQAQRQGVPMCNYGIAIAYLTGILDKVTLPRQ